MSVRKYRDRSCAWDWTQGSNFLSFIPSCPDSLLIGSFLFRIFRGWWKDVLSISRSFHFALRLDYLVFPPFSFVFLICLSFIPFYFLSTCVALVLSRFGGAFVVSFVLEFVSVGVSASRGKENGKRTPMEFTRSIRNHFHCSPLAFQTDSRTKVGSSFPVGKLITV